jgi:hypothetical protein
LRSGVEVRIETDASLSPAEVNAAYAWAEWPSASRGGWRRSREAAGGRGPRPEGSLVGIARVLDDGALHASLWDVIVQPDRRRGESEPLVRPRSTQCAIVG